MNAAFATPRHTVVLTIQAQYLELHPNLGTVPRQYESNFVLLLSLNYYNVLSYSTRGGVLQANANIPSPSRSRGLALLPDGRLLIGGNTDAAFAVVCPSADEMPSPFVFTQ